jgi:Ras-related protein Rab-6A
MADENPDLNISVTNFKKFKLVFLGDQSVGKSSIISRYVYDTFENSSHPTIGVDFVVKSVYSGENTYKIHFWDTAGQERFKSLIPSYIKDCQVAILVYDVCNRESFDNIKSWYENIKNERGDDIILGLLGNKIDLEKRAVTTEEGFKKAEEINALFQEVSAKTGNNLTPFFKLVLETLIKNLDDEEQDADKEDGQNLDDFRKKNTGNGKKGCC